jgi:hypothetical protein
VYRTLSSARFTFNFAHNPATRRVNTERENATTTNFHIEIIDPGTSSDTFMPNTDEINDSGTKIVAIVDSVVKTFPSQLLICSFR